jgi:hypothetical protein
MEMKGSISVSLRDAVLLFRLRCRSRLVMDGTRGKRKGNLGIYEGYTPVWAVASKLVDLLGLADHRKGTKEGR